MSDHSSAALGNRTEALDALMGSPLGVMVGHVRCCEGRLITPSAPWLCEDTFTDYSMVLIMSLDITLVGHVFTGKSNLDPYVNLDN